MKKKYNSPDFDIVSLYMTDVLAASTYKPVPEDPTRDGNDGGGGGLDSGLTDG